MPFLIGYFGKIPQIFAKKIEQIAHEHAIPESAFVIQDNFLSVFAGTNKNEIQSDYVVPIGNTHGLLVGKIFDKEDYERVGSFKNHEIEVFIRNPKFLTSHFWGRYSGILYDKTARRVALVRDPLGLNTLFYMQTNDGILFSSELALLYDCLEKKPDLDLQYFAEYIVAENHALASTPFNSINELQPGMAFNWSIDGRSKLELIWDLDTVKSSFITSTHVFEDELLNVLKKSTKAWISDSKSICVELSGGLDSSSIMILLNEVMSADQKLIAINYIDSKEPSSNEISYAQEIADICNAPLHLIDWQKPLSYELLQPWRSSKPTTFLLLDHIDARLYQIARSHGCTQVLNGQGGDHVFVAPPHEHALADYWIAHGFKGSNIVSNELAAYYRMSLPSLISKNMYAIGKHYLNISSKKKQSDFLSTDFASNFKHSDYYLQKIIQKKFYPAKTNHILDLAHGVLYADRNQRFSDLTFAHPLLSQPLVELGLQVPTYQTFGQGYDRILFRNAISKIKKPNALWRRQKGDTTTSMLKALASNSDEILRSLLQGSLFKSGMINRIWLENTIINIKHGKTEQKWPLMKLLSAQLWLNQWNY